jgi:hypothetical protein
MMKIITSVAVVGLLFAGCSSPAPSLQDACANFASITRTRQATCYGVAPVPDQSTLISREIQSCVLNSDAPGSQVDASYWEGCAAAADNGCAAFQCATYPLGTRMAGEPCLVSTQCASLWCKGVGVIGAGGSVLGNAVQCGTCASRLAEGESCDVANDACEVGLSCFGGACRVKGQQGAPCAARSDCALPWVCKSNGICNSITPDGQPCITSSDCTTDTACDVTTKLCTPKQFAQPGAMCDGEVHDCEAGECDKATGACPTILPDGAACDPSDASTVCGDYARCFEGKCQIPDPATCR